MVLGSDDVLYGPLKWSRLRMPAAPLTEEMGRVWSVFRQRELAYNLLRRRLTQFLLDRRNPPPLPPLPIEENVMVVDVWEEVWEEVREEVDDIPVCSVCLTPSPSCHESPCGFHICESCTAAFVETRFTTPPTTTSVPCPCGGGVDMNPCVATLPWKHVANSVDDATMDRLVALYSKKHEPQVTTETQESTLEDCVDRINVAIRARLETAYVPYPPHLSREVTRARV